MRIVTAAACVLLLPLVAQAQEGSPSGRYSLTQLGTSRRILLRVERSGPGLYAVERRDSSRVLRGVGRYEAGVLSVVFRAATGLIDGLSKPSAKRLTLNATYRFSTRRVLGLVDLPDGPSGAARRYEVGSLAAPLARAPASLNGRLTVKGRVFRDPYGRDVLLRGVNVGLKRAPFLPPHSEADVAALVQATGINFVRLSVSWRALEPQPLAYDAEYLDGVEASVRRWTDAGVSVLIDMHQDVWGGSLARHGAPEWATLTGDARALDLPEGSPWQLRYLDPRCRHAFEALWSNARVPESRLGLQDHYARAWGALASRLANVERVVGYDLMNEPFYGREIVGALARLAGTALMQIGDLRFAGRSLGAFFRALLAGRSIQDALLAEVLVHARRPEVFELFARSLARTTGRFERRLSAFYGRVGREIHRHDPGRPLFLEPMALAGVGIPSSLQRPGGSKGIVYAPHLYDPFVDSGLGYDGDNTRLHVSAQRSLAAAQCLGAPLVFGEWGNLHGPLEAFARDTGRMIDDALASSAYWDHVPGRESEPLFLEAFRPYPRRVAGTLRAIRWDAVARRLTVRYEARPLAGRKGVAPTVIQLRPGLFPSGVKVTISDPMAEHAILGQRVLVWTEKAGDVTVTVSAQ